MDTNGFIVKFNRVGPRVLSWEERIARPVTDEKIVKAVKKKKAATSKEIDAESTSDYGGIILAGGRQIGDYFIMPGSEIAKPAAKRKRTSPSATGDGKEKQMACDHSPGWTFVRQSDLTTGALATCDNCAALLHLVRAGPARWTIVRAHSLAQVEKALERAQKTSTKAAEARAAMPPGSSRARVTTANARWMRASEERDRRAADLDCCIRSRKCRPVQADAGRGGG